MIPLRASIKHPINVYIFGCIHCSDWLNAWNNKGQCNVLYCTLFLWIAAFFGNLPGCWLFMCCLTSERFKTMGKCVSSNMCLQKPLWHCIKSGYKESRLRAPWCIVCINVVDISSMGELALTSHLKGKKTSKTDIPEKVTSKCSRLFWRFVLTTSYHRWWCQSSFKIHFIWKWRTQ